MKKSIRLIPLGVLLVGFLSRLGAADLYVAPNGNDAASGAKTAPLATLDGARSKVRGLIAGGLKEPVTVWIRGGVYELRKTVVFDRNDSGSEKYPVTYRAYEGEKPVFDGSVLLGDWKKCDTLPPGAPQAAAGNLWYCDVPKVAGAKWNIKSLYDEQSPLLLPRSRSKAVLASEKQFNDIYNAQPKNIIKELKNTTTAISFHQDLCYNEGDMRDWANASDIEVFLRPKHRWLVNMLPIEKIDAAKKTVRLTVPPTYAIAPGNPYYIENAIDYLDTAGEWCYNSIEGRVYMWPAGDLGTAKIRAPYLQEFIRVEGTEEAPAQFIQFEGLTFLHGLRTTWEPGDKTLQHDWELYDKGNAVVRFRSAQHCTLKGCTIKATSGTGVRLDMYCQYITVSDNLMSFLGGSGVVLSGYGPGLKDVNKYNKVHNNTIHHTGQIYAHSPAIFIAQSGRNMISHNTIYDLPYDAIVTSGCRPDELLISQALANRREWVSQINVEECKPFVDKARETGRLYDMTIYEPLLHARENQYEYNEIYRAMQQLGDGNGIYFSAMGVNNRLFRNFVHQMHETYGLIRLDDDPSFTIIEENVVMDGNKQFSIKGSCLLRNNFAVDVRDLVVGLDKDPLTTLDYNVYYGTEETLFELGGRKKEEANTEWGAVSQSKNSIVYKPGKPLKDFSIGSDLFEKEQQGKGTVGILYADPMFDREAMKKKIFTFLPGSPALKLGIKPIDLSNVGSTIVDPDNTKRVYEALEFFEWRKFAAKQAKQAKQQ